VSIDHEDRLDDLEPERYELTGLASYVFTSDRREFLKLFGGGLAVLVVANQWLRAQDAGGRDGSTAPGEQNPDAVSAWLHVDAQGGVTVFTGKVEVGQNIRTSLTQAVADELHVAPTSISLVMGDTSRTPFDAGTFGSRTTPLMAPQLRGAAAAAREALIDLAAARLAVDRTSLKAADGQVRHQPSGGSVTYGELTRGERITRVIGAQPGVMPRDDWQIAGTAFPKVEGRAFVTGRHQYTSDLRLEGMLHGRIIRPPAFGASLVDADLTAARRIPGVVAVRDRDFIGVAAPDARSAARAAAAVSAEWKTMPQVSGRDLFDHLRRSSAADSPERARPPVHTSGSTDEGRRIADAILEATYTVAYIAHVPLEPRAAVAEWTDEGLTVWTGTQRPFGVRNELADAFRLAPERVRVVVPDTGSAYGGKHTGEAAVEAARLAKAARRPVKLVWTREEEFTWAYARPAGVIDVRSGVTRDGRIVSWEFDNYNSGAAAIRTRYDVPHQRIAFHPSQSPLRQGSYRALAATANHFARETHLDEAAQKIGMDAVEFRLRNLSDMRMRDVLTAAAERIGWGKAGGDGLGLAAGFEKGSWIATAVALSVERGEVRIHRIVSAYDCGAVVNPDGLRNQVDGAIVQGLGGALFEAIEFDNGRLLNARLGSYRVPRFSDTPPIETVLLDRRDEPPAGAGETPIVALAPAIGNAIFRATGVRLRSLPLAPSGVQAEGPPSGGP
jgi:CO/xanthine dehydrogenase Mo-binding subunit